MHFGVAVFPTEDSPDPATIARMTEERGFESLFFPEHTHITVSRRTPYPVGGDLPREYSHTHDPLVALAFAAAATTTLKLGTGIMLIAQRDPITTAKAIASLDVLSGGRVLLGVQDDVCRLVQRRLGGLGGGEVRVDDDAASAVGRGVAVGLSGDRLALDGPALAGEVVRDGGEDAERVVSAQAVGERARVVGLGVDGVGLGHVEHGHGEEPHTALLLLLAGLLVLDGLAHVAAAEDADSALALAGLAAELLPCAVARDGGRPGGPRRDLVSGRQGGAAVGERLLRRGGWGVGFCAVQRGELVFV